MDEVFGLPAHPFLVHVPVVLIPLVAVGAIALAVRPSWRNRLSGPLALAALVTTVGVFLAQESGESLEERIDETDRVEHLVDEHAEQAEPMLALSIISLVALGASALTTRSARAEDASAGRAKAALGVAVLAALLSTATAVQVARVGHSGADAVWSDVDEDRSGRG